MNSYKHFFHFPWRGVSSRVGSVSTLDIGDSNLVTFGVCWIKLMALLT